MGDRTASTEADGSEGDPDAPGLAIAFFEPDHILGLEGWGVFVLEPTGRAERHA